LPTEPIATRSTTVAPPRRRPAGAHPAPAPSRRARRVERDATKSTRRLRRERIVRRVLVGALVVVLLFPAWSWYRAISAEGTDPFLARSVEWLRDNGMSGAVDWIEHWWYTHHEPPVGGRPEHGLPKAQAPTGEAAAAPDAPAAPVHEHLTPPPPMQPLVAEPLDGEGVWQPTGRTVAGVPAVYTSFFRPDAIHTSLVAGAMWMDTTLLTTKFVPGLQEPGGPQTLGAQVPPELRPGLVAAFNSGFKIESSKGGVYTEGQVVAPLVDGAASFVINKDGQASVGAWGRDFQMGPDIASVRQNLALILDNGQPAPGLPNNADGAWGASVGNEVYVWRSGVGVDANGALVYVAGPAMSAQTLAVLLQRAGCVRAMELDINAPWTTGYTYEQTDPADPAAVQGVKLLPNMPRDNNRYLTPGERDFFALFAAY
ncbi:MAG TPA: phosphodiester glycosidase family protein, partial [Acidimicrobiia bacterium]